MMLRVPLACFPGGVIFGLSPYAIRQNLPELKEKSIFSAQFCIFVRPHRSVLERCPRYRSVLTRPPFAKKILGPPLKAESPTS